MFLPYFSLWGSGVSPLWPKMMGDGSQTSIALGHVALESVGFVPLGFLCKSQTFFFFFLDAVAPWPPQGHHGNRQSK